jgi:phosphoglycolate phosphatase-like HAD superfamily hydrolase
MEPTILYALDFDGVICDSAVETGMTGWKAAAQLWHDMPKAIPSTILIDRFRQVRPIIETGYEAILAMRLLHQDMSVETILNDFFTQKQALLDQTDTTEDDLKKRFGAVRDAWIEDSLDDWIAMNPLFPNVAEKLKTLTEQDLCYIVTTKQERFVASILKANGITLSADKIFGLDRNKSKETVLTGLMAQYPQRTFYFVEDRLPTLLKVLANDRLANVNLLFASWGYNTADDKQQALRHPIKIISLKDFILIVDQNSAHHLALGEGPKLEVRKVYKL